MAEHRQEKTPGLAGRGGTSETANSTALLVSEPAAARMLGLSPRKVWQLAKDGVLPVCRVGGAKRYSTVALREWVDRGCPSTPWAGGGA